MVYKVVPQRSETVSETVPYSKPCFPVHISVFVRLMKGEYDNDLVWPFEGDFVIELLNWKADKDHYLNTFRFNRYIDPNALVTSRLTDEEYAPHGWGFSCFISHSSLLYNPDTKTEYLQDDCLRLRVVDVVIYSTPLLLSKTPSWQDPQNATQSVCDFTLTEFTKRKQSNNSYYSPPFYSHPHGYKLCLNVVANGRGKGKDTHISIHAYLMRGDYDNNLQWPFEGDIVVEFLNWREDKNHYRYRFSLNNNIDLDNVYTSRVSEGEYALQCFGGSAIRHSSLLYNPKRNIEYLQDDCLRLRVVDVVVYSTPLHPKTPSWQDPHTATQSVCDFTLTEFTKRKQFNNEYYSPPFYSHTNGYKMHLKVCANFHHFTKGSRISVFVCLLSGENDSDLDWPFKGAVIVELLNWKEDNSHLMNIIVFNKSTPLACSSRVAEKAVQSQGWGAYDQQYVFSHSSLPYNPVTNTEYLHDNCLRFRVTEVNVHK